MKIGKYSKWPACYKLNSSPFKEIVDILRRQFLDFGQPKTLVSDNASYFTSIEFKSFLETLDVEHITVSPYFSSIVHSFSENIRFQCVYFLTEITYEFRF